MVIFARLGGPGADAAFGAPHLDGAGHIGRSRDAPVEAVAAEIGEPAAAFRIALQRVERGSV